MVFVADRVSQQLDELLVRRLISYAKSISFNVQLFNEDHKKGKSIGNTIFDSLIGQYIEGRGNFTLNILQR